MTGDRSGCLLAGCGVYIRKPVNPGSFIEELVQRL